MQKHTPDLSRSSARFLAPGSAFARSPFTQADGLKSASRRSSGAIGNARSAIANGDLGLAIKLIRTLVDATGNREIPAQLRRLVDDFIQAQNQALVAGKTNRAMRIAA